MKRLHGMILRMLPGPILGWLGTLMFLLLMQFLIKYLPDIAGKGLPFSVIVELVAYNLAYMVVLAVPMSVLIGTLMVFARISESRAYVVAKSSGVSPMQLIWPTLIVGIFLTAGMTYFNNIVLPEANFRARNLWFDIRQKRPGFELEAGTFYEGLNKYSILVQKISHETGRMEDILIFDYTDENRSQTVIKASDGEIVSEAEHAEMILTLRNGEVHRLLRNQRPDVAERYERLAFQQYRFRLDLSDFTFERSNPEEGYRSDRTMRTGDMIGLVDSLEMSSENSRARMAGGLLSLMKGPVLFNSALADSAVRGDSGRVALADVDRKRHRRVYDVAVTHARTSRAMLDDLRRGLEWEQQRADRFRVEIHKKYSIALACLIFVLIGAPLGLSIRRGGLGRAAGLAIAVFLFYWVTLVQGEKLADRGFLTPWVGMWAANIVMTILGLWLMVYVSLDLQATPSLRTRFFRRVRLRE